MIVDVAVGRGVSVATVGVIVGLGVNVGIDAAVCVDAALTVCAMNVLTAFGSIVGTDGVPREGAHAMITARAVTQTNNFVLRVAAIVSSSTSDQNRNTGLDLLFNDDRYIGVAQTTFHNEGHDIRTFLGRCNGVKIHSKFRARL